MSDTVLNSNLVNLKDKINQLIKTSSSAELKSFFQSTTGKFLIDVLQISHGSFNYTVDALKDEMFFGTMVDYNSVVEKASDLGYHIKRLIPAKMKYNVQINDPNNRLNGISRIVFKGREFKLDYNGVNLIQENSYTYYLNKTNYDYYNYLVEGQLVNDTFTVNSFTNFFKHYLDDTNISNYIDSNNDLDLKLYSKYYGEESNLNDIANGVALGQGSVPYKYINVFRNGITESDINLNDGYYAFSSTTSDKELEIMFGNGTFGKVGYGDYIIEYLRTNGNTANQKIKSGDTINIPTSGIEVYDINGNLLDSSIVAGLVQIVTTTDLDGGMDYETSEDIKFNAVKLSALNNTLVTDKDFEYLINYKYNVNMNVWGDNYEAKNRMGEVKDLNNMVFLTSPDLVYDFEENINNIKFNILENRVYMNTGYSSKNKNGVFNVVKNCSAENVKRGDCISLSSLYLMGFFKPLMYYYKMGVVYGDNTTSAVSKIIDEIDNKGSLNNCSYVFINGDFLDFNANIYYSGNLTVDTSTIKTEIKTDFAVTKNLVQSVNKVLTKYGLNYNGISKDYLTVNTFENKSLYDFLSLTTLRKFEVDMVMSIVDRMNTNFHKALTTPMRMSQFLRNGTSFIHEFMKHCPPNKTVITSVMSYYINKYNALKSLIINQGNYNLLDIKFISEDLTDVTLTKVV